MDSPPDCFFADPDEPETPNRSPSRLDFCMEDSDVPPTDEIDWAFTSSRDNSSYSIIDEDAFSVDITPLDHPHLLIVPQTAETYIHKNADTSFMSPASSEHPKNLVEPQVPIPVRPPSVQLQVDGQEYAQPARPASQRLNYPHHGFSRSALLQQKMLWSLRHEEWVEWQSHIEHGARSERSVAYTGIATAQPSPPPCMRTPPSGLERDLAEHPPSKREQILHSSIYPRVGDITALRDPYSVNIDRSLSRYPLWTLHKTLYVFNMIQRFAPSLPPASVCNAPRVQSSMSWSSLSSYTSSATDDEESDSTLVADDGPIPIAQPLKAASPPHDPLSWCHLWGWESWYAKWELLFGLLRRERIRCDGFDASMISDAPPKPKEPSLSSSARPARLFHFTLAEDDSDDDEDEDDDNDDDYGTLLSHTRFSVEFDEECERALAFYCRESKRSGTAM